MNKKIAQYMTDSSYMANNTLINVEKLIFRFKSEEENTKNNKILVENLLSLTDKIYPYIGEKIKKDRQFTLEQIKKNSWILEHVSDEFKGDREIVSAAIEANPTGLVFYYASKNLKNDKELIKQAVQKGFHDLHLLTENIQKDKNFMLELVNIYGFIAVSSNYNKNDKEIIIAGINKQPNIFKYCSINFRNDYDISLLAIEKDINNIESIGDELKEEIGDNDILTYLNKMVFKQNLEKTTSHIPVQNNNTKKIKI